VVEDSGRVIVVGVRTAELASRIARTDAVHIRRALSLVGRPKTVVRLRVNLAGPHEAPDFYVRDVGAPESTSPGAL
jgi:hypothetical protein